jgi:hypothetical protein
MKTFQNISTNSLSSEELFIRSPIFADYVWNNIITNRRVSMGWLYKLYKNSMVHDVFLLLTSPIS